jgi:hypothetical protein
MPKKVKKQNTSSKSKAWKEGELIDTFHLNRIATYQTPLMQEWLNAELPNFHPAEQYYFEKLLVKAQKSLVGWNEEDLKVKFIGPILELGSLMDDDRVIGYFDKTISAVVEKIRLLVKSDFMLAKGTLNVVEKLLKLINSVLFSKTKDFTYRIRRKSKAAQVQKGRKIMPIEHSLNELTPNEWSKLSADEQMYFFKKEVQENKLQKTVYAWTNPWMFEARICKKFLTQIQVIDRQLASEAAEIHNYLTFRNLHPKVSKIIYGGCNYGRVDFRLFLEAEAVWRETCEELNCVSYPRPTQSYTI